ncbi:hypothetical protein WJX82_000905 [Trebouxia sp. C0006]
MTIRRCQPYPAAQLGLRELLTPNFATSLWTRLLEAQLILLVGAVAVKEVPCTCSEPFSAHGCRPRGSSNPCLSCLLQADMLARGACKG